MHNDRYMGALAAGERGEAALVGVPFYVTTSLSPGARFGPNAIRKGSHNLEKFGPFNDRDLRNMDYIDLGDLELEPDSVGSMTDKVYAVVGEILDKDMRPVILGGEHIVSVGAIKRMVQNYPDLVVLQLDAHFDLKCEYSDDAINHTSVIQQIVDLITSERLYRISVHAVSREESIKAGIKMPLGFNGSLNDIERVLESIPKDKPVYVSLDMDVFDPSLVPSGSNPGPVGLTYREFVQLVRGLAYWKLVGFDIVELTPQYDQTGVSSVVAASVVRDLMMCMM
ncbi:MAG: agmatinase [Candidatus Hatepunaea meridiana]|nr:agmatinase [Candidatus Hatepunaea meridiana]